MGKAAVLSHPAHGHINPTLPVIAELIRRGEQVTYYATEPFRSGIENTGAQFHSYGPQELFERNLAIGGMLGGMGGLIETTETILPELERQLRVEQPDYLLLDSHAVWGNLVQQILSIPAATFCAMFALHAKVISSDELIRRLYLGASGETLLAGMMGLSHYMEAASRFASRYGTRAPGIIDYLSNPQELNIVFTSREFQMGGDLFPSSYKFVGPSLATRSEAPFFPLDELGDEPLIYISMGTMYNSDIEFYHLCFDALKDNGSRVVLATGNRLDPKTLRTPPSNFIVRRHVPQLDLLPRASLFITHGGMNSANEGLYYGIPMLLLPQQADQFFVSDRVAELGAGLCHCRNGLTAPVMADLVRESLSQPAIKEQAMKLGESLRKAGGYQRAADEIIALKAKHQLC
jgi:MGT family glycosyltransferase